MLMLGEAEHKTIKAIVEVAKLNPISAADIQAWSQARGADLEKWQSTLNVFTMDLPVDYAVTYTREYQPPGLCHHLSVSNAHGIPTAMTLSILCHAFGMGDVVESKRAVHAWPEQYPSGRIALNILSLV